MGSLCPGDSYRVQTSEAGNYITIYPSTGTLFPNVAVIIAFAVVFTVVGSNTMVTATRVPGLRVTPPDESLVE